MAELLLYCIADAASALPGDGRGVHGGGLLRIVHGGLAAVVSPLAEPARVATPARAELLEYERVIRAWHAVADVLPMRFGSVLSDETAVRAHLDAQRAVYPRALERIAGCVELGVRALVSAPPPPAAPVEGSKPESRSGADYLKARQQRHSAENRLRDQCAALEQALLSKVAPWCREHRSELSSPRSGGPMLCSLYFLVPREQVAAFRAALSPMPPVGGPAELTLSGPWPPFNFVT
jgi:hypothetical protein